MFIKDGVEIDGCRAEILLAVIKIEASDIFQREVVITSGTESKHKSEYSGHYRGDAIDLRNYWWIDKINRLNKAQQIRDLLGPDYWVLLEKTHYHIEYRPGYTEA